jgi:hypothetical protein
VKWDGKVPVKDGAVMHYPAKYVSGWEMQTWSSSQEMKFSRVERGRSAAVIWMRGQDAREYPMFLSEFARLVPYLVGGVWRGPWVGVKRGQNYGISPVLP